MSTFDAGYSGTPLHRKLGVKDGERVALIGAPDGFEEHLGDAVVTRRLRGHYGLIVCFITTRRSLERRLPQLLAAREARGSLWVAWPKLSSGVVSDLRETFVRDTVLETGLVDNKVCAIDDTWSALRFVARRAPSP